MPERILVTGGAGFVGSSLALGFAQRWPQAEVIAVDNLRRRGSELALPRLAAGGVAFAHVDVRVPSDLATLGRTDWIVDAAAEPSVLAGADGSLRQVLDTNLVATTYLVELARAWSANVVFLSTSRVYPVDALNALSFTEGEDAFAWDDDQAAPGASGQGIDEQFGTDGSRSWYGTSKLCSEMLFEELAASTQTRVVVDRCGLVAGPWQMGKVDQGVVAQWVLHHLTGKPLRFIGWGGQGKQVRDVLHVADLVELVGLQIEAGGQGFERWNVGGGLDNAVSLRELTALCTAATGTTLSPEADPPNRPYDLRLYITDARRVAQAYGWSARRSVSEVVADLFAWARDHQSELERAGVI